MNKHCYIHTPLNEPLVKRTVELKQDILQQLFGWSLQVIDEQEYLKLAVAEREPYILQRISP
jgi:hypothetical protein